MENNDKNYLLTMCILNDLFIKELLTEKEYNEAKVKINQKYKTKYQFFFED